MHLLHLPPTSNLPPPRHAPVLLRSSTPSLEMRARRAVVERVRPAQVFRRMPACVRPVGIAQRASGLLSPQDLDAPCPTPSPATRTPRTAPATPAPPLALTIVLNLVLPIPSFRADRSLPCLIALRPPPSTIVVLRPRRRFLQTSTSLSERAILASCTTRRWILRR